MFRCWRRAALLSTFLLSHRIVDIYCQGSALLKNDEGRSGVRCARDLQQVPFDFRDQKWQVGLCKAQTRRNEAIVLDAGMYMFVMGMGALQFRNAGMYMHECSAPAWRRRVQLRWVQTTSPAQRTAFTVW